MSVPPARLIDVLEHSRRLGFLGLGPVEAHVGHARAFLRAVAAGPVGTLVDLGSGGGVPGLILAVWGAARSFILVDGSERRTSYLSDAVHSLQLDNVKVVRARAELLGHEAVWRGRADVVVARSFGSPAATAECAAPLLRVGGRLVVSEPPGEGGHDRWPADGVAQLGLRVAERVEEDAGRVQVLTQVSACPVRFARRVGVPAKRPLF